MRRIWALILPLCLLLTACGESADKQIDELQALYGSLSGYTTQAQVKIVREDENIDFTVFYEKNGDTIRVKALAPESVKGITAIIEGESLQLEYGGRILDAGILSGKLSAVSCVPQLLRDFSKSYISAWSEEELDGESVLCLQFEKEWAGENITCTVRFAKDNKPLYAEFSEDGKIFAAVGFTDFEFGDILSANP